MRRFHCYIFVRFNQKCNTDSIVLCLNTEKKTESISKYIHVYTIKNLILILYFFQHVVWFPLCQKLKCSKQLVFPTIENNADILTTNCARYNFRINIILLKRSSALYIYCTFSNTIHNTFYCVSKQNELLLDC